MEALPGRTDDAVEPLKELVKQLLARLDGVEEQLADLGTQVRLQARRASSAAHLQLPLAQLAGGGASSSGGIAGSSAAASPRGVG